MLVPSLLCRGRCLGKKLRKKARKLRKGNKKCRDKSVDDDDGPPSTSIGAEVSTASVANGKPDGEGDGAHVADAGADPVPRHDREVREDASDRTRVGDGGAPLAEARDEDGGYGEGRPRPRGAVGCPLLSEASSFSLVAAMASQDTQEEDAGAGEEEEEGDGDDDDEEVPMQSPSLSSDSSLDEPQRTEVESGNDDDFRPDEAFPPLETASSSLSCFSLVKLFQEEEEDGGEGGEGIISPPDIDVLHLVSQSSSGIGSTASMVSECASGTTPDGEVSAGADDNEEDVDDTDGDGDRHAPMEDYPVEATQIRHQIGDGASASPVASCGAGVGESSIAAAATTGDHPSRGPDEDEVVADASPPAAPASLSDPPSFDAPLADDGSERWGQVISSVPSSCTVVDDDEGKQPEQEQRQATEEEDGAHERGEPDEKHEDEDRDRSDVWHYAEIEATDSRVEVSFSLSPRRANEDTYVVADEDDEDDECSELEVRTAASAAKRRSGDAKLTPGLVEDDEGSLPLKRARTSTTLRKAAPIRFDGWACFAPNGVEGGNFAILGTSANDLQSRPHVLSPPLMESLRSFLPFSCSEENFWMKYSLIRDGASYETLLSKVRASRRTVLAIETMEGEVFGSFTSSPWRVQPDFFGSGEAFLWRLKKSRWFVPGDKEETTLLRRLDSEIEVYPYTNFDRYIQLCTRDRMALGGGQWQPPEDCPYPDELAEGGGGGGGMGLVLGEELETGSSHTCATFASPGLSRLSSMNGGRQFQIANVEVWTLTPFATVQAAETSDLRKSFIEEQTSRAVHSY